MNAHPDEQRSLLVLHDVDVTLAQLEHRERTLPQRAVIEELQASHENSQRERILAVGVLEDAQQELSKLESDVALVSARIERDTAREAQGGSAKDTAALESELVSLRQRRSQLEDVEIEVMQKVEDAERALGAVDAEIADRVEKRRLIESELAAAIAEISREREEIRQQRRARAATLSEELLAAYEKRLSRSGVGAAMLRQRTCGACTLTLTGADLERIRSTPSDVVVLCPECDAILVRTEESGL